MKAMNKRPKREMKGCCRRAKSGENEGTVKGKEKREGGITVARERHLRKRESRSQRPHVAFTHVRRGVCSLRNKPKLVYAPSSFSVVACYTLTQPFYYSYFLLIVSIFYNNNHK